MRDFFIQTYLFPFKNLLLSKKINSFENSILILSHPDDESIFASSLLDKISTLIICFNDFPKNTKSSIGRKRALNNYPLKHLKVMNLDISQSLESLLPLNWLNIKDKKTGLKGGYQKKIYDNNYYKILDKLRKLIPKKVKLLHIIHGENMVIVNIVRFLRHVSRFP